MYSLQAEKIANKFWDNWRVSNKNIDHTLRDVIAEKIDKYLQALKSIHEYSDESLDKETLKLLFEET